MTTRDPRPPVTAADGDAVDELAAQRAWRVAHDRLQRFAADNPLPDLPDWTPAQRQGFAEAVRAEVEARGVLDGRDDPLAH